MESLLKRFRADASAHSVPRTADPHRGWANGVEVADIAIFDGCVTIKLEESRKNKKKGVAITLNMSATAVAMLMASVTAELKSKLDHCQRWKSELENRCELAESQLSPDQMEAYEAAIEAGAEVSG